MVHDCQLAWGRDSLLAVVDGPESSNDGAHLDALVRLLVLQLQDESQRAVRLSEPPVWLAVSGERLVGQQARQGESASGQREGLRV